MVVRAEFAGQLKIFFLGCVIIAGIFAGSTVHRLIFFIQGVPAHPACYRHNLFDWYVIICCYNV